MSAPNSTVLDHAAVRVTVAKPSHDNWIHLRTVGPRNVPLIGTPLVLYCIGIWSQRHSIDKLTVYSLHCGIVAEGAFA